MEIIKIESKPEKVIEVYSGSIELDQKYGFCVEKRINNKQIIGTNSPYSVLEVYVIADEKEVVDKNLLEVIKITIVNWCEKNGIGNPPADKK